MIRIHKRNFSFTNMKTRKYELHAIKKLKTFIILYWFFLQIQLNERKDFKAKLQKET